MITLEILKSTQAVIGIVLGSMGLIGSVFVWWDRRSRRFIVEHTGPIEARGDAVIGRLDRVESKVGEIEKDVEIVRGRVAEIERGLAQLASKEDLGKLAVEMAGLKATTEQTSGKVDTIYRAALASSKDRT